MKRGFTLVEVIATLAILSILGIVIAIGFRKFNTKQTCTDYQKFVEQVETAACEYLELSVSYRKKVMGTSTSHNFCTKEACKIGYSTDIGCTKHILNDLPHYNDGCKVTIGDLVYVGLLDKDLTDLDGKTIEEAHMNNIVKIVWNSSKQKSCTYEYKPTEAKACD